MLGNLLRSVLAKSSRRHSPFKYVHHYCTGVQSPPHYSPSINDTGLRFSPEVSINIMMDRFYFLEIEEDEDEVEDENDDEDVTFTYRTNTVVLDKNGLVDPNPADDDHNSALYIISEDKADLAQTIDDHLMGCGAISLDPRDTYVCQIPDQTPIPDELQLWETRHNDDYILRAKVPLPLSDLQVLLNRFQEKHGKIMDFGEYLSSDTASHGTSYKLWSGNAHFLAVNLDQKVRRVRFSCPSDEVYS